MAYEITRAEVWAGEIEDRPGTLAEKLGALQQVGANLDFVIVRPAAGIPGQGVLFVAPLHGAQQIAAAEGIGLRKSTTMHVLRIAGPDRPGLGAGLARSCAEVGLNIAGLSAAGVADTALFYIRFLTDADAKRAAQVLTQKLG